MSYVCNFWLWLTVWQDVPEGADGPPRQEEGTVVPVPGWWLPHAFLLEGPRHWHCWGGKYLIWCRVLYKKCSVIQDTISGKTQKSLEIKGGLKVFYSCNGFLMEKVISSTVLLLFIFAYERCLPSDVLIPCHTELICFQITGKFKCCLESWFFFHSQKI